MKRVFLKGIKGGTGTTSVLANLACALKTTKEHVYVIDLDPKSDLGLHLGLPWSHELGWSNFDSFKDASSQFHQDSDGVIFLPFGANTPKQFDASMVIDGCNELEDAHNAWILFDCPAHIDVHNYSLNQDDIFLEVVNCDSICHSLMYKRMQSLKTVENPWQHYFLANRYNSAFELEFDLMQLWQSQIPLLASLYINKDEVIKEATAFRNVAFNCAPESVAYDDFEALAGWLVSRLASEQSPKL